VPALEDKHVRIFSRIRPGSADLTGLFARGRAVPLANDTSCGAGFAPLTDLERVVLQVEQHLNSPEIKADHPAIGSDVKVMGVRRGDAVTLTVGCAFIGRHLASLGDYVRAKELVRMLSLAAAKEASAVVPDVGVNLADDLESGDVFLTVSGTSAEAGDDGEVGRGNRANGLITPYRPMTMEAPSGKNPVSHVGKLYQVLANRIAQALVSQLPKGCGAECCLVSQIGHPIDDPQLAHVRLLGTRSTIAPATRALATEVIQAELRKLPSLREEFVAGHVSLF
jgi:S-adenosylmethionine synthetase